jgi:hypothetical protein
MKYFYILLSLIIICGCSTVSIKKSSEKNINSSNSNNSIDNNTAEKSSNLQSSTENKDIKNLNSKNIIPSCLLNFSKILNSSLCELYKAKNNLDCNIEILKEIKSRNLYSYEIDSCKLSKYIEPPLVNINCFSFIKKIVSRTDSINQACIQRYKPSDRDSLLCRKDLNNFISANSKGIGSNIKTCGQD